MPPRGIKTEGVDRIRMVKTTAYQKYLLLRIITLLVAGDDDFPLIYINLPSAVNPQWADIKSRIRGVYESPSAPESGNWLLSRNGVRKIRRSGSSARVDRAPAV
ncbi:hypothetical protein KCP76_21750 [Salmonella enterica subsp. enterica serovar Weltevreden]|nr:hypothetical protein KCP76_21750 [Salmonella enterica subsp. enterica serovar Weltevreden]